MIQNTRRWQPYPAYKPSNVPWLGDIPAHWEVRRLKSVARFIYGDSLAAEERERGNVPVYGSNGQVDVHSVANTFAPVIVIGRKGSFGKINFSEVPVFAIDTTYFIDSRNTSADLKWLAHVLRLLNLDQASQDSAIPGLSRDVAYGNFIPVPLLPEQHAIAAFLDRETARLDALIAKKEQLIERLQEKRTALISRAVTKGLDANAPMKDSGVEWVGEVPEGWGLCPLRRVINKFVDYRGATPEKVSAGIPLVTARNVKNGRIDFELSQEYLREQDYDDWMIRGLPELGDVLVTTEAPLGETAQITDTRIALAQRIILLKADKSQITNDFLQYFLTSLAGQGELWSRATGSTAIGIKAYHLKEILVTLPPLKEQMEITNHIERETSKYDALVAKIQDAIERLREYRGALIAAAVTGKVDVRDG